MAELAALVSYLDTLLKPGEFEDASFNGVQVRSAQEQISRVGVAVDAGESVIKMAVDKRCELLIVHHGMMWGSEQPITGAFGRKVALLLSGGCSLFASHLPLDAHAEAGNNVLLARHFELTVEGGFATFGPKQIGVRARSATPRTREYFVEKARALTGAREPLLLPFGPDKISTAGIVSGSGASALAEAAAVGLDLLISGEPKQHVYHDAKEFGINCVFAGHYATETLGVRALGDLLAQNFGIESVFLDEPTGI